MGTKVDEQDPACVPNAKYTLGEFSVSGVSLVFAIYYYFLISPFPYRSFTLLYEVIKTVSKEIFVLCTALNWEVRAGHWARVLQFRRGDPSTKYGSNCSYWSSSQRK